MLIYKMKENVDDTYAIKNRSHCPRSHNFDFWKTSMCDDVFEMKDLDDEPN